MYRSDRQAWRISALLALFILSYLILDWASFIAPIKGLNVTAWNPAPALGVMFILHWGRLAIPAVFAAIVLSDVLIRSPESLSATLLVDAVLAVGYAAMAHVLKRHFNRGGVFIDRKGLLEWTLIITLGSLLNGVMFVSSLTLAGLLDIADWQPAVLRFWIGDAIGIYITMPLLWWLADPVRRKLFEICFYKPETLAYLGLVIVAIWLALVYGSNENYRFFYVLFLPVVWASSRQGVAGAVLCATALQIGMLIVGSMMDSADVSVFEIQLRAFLLALIAFLIGVTVDEHRRALAELHGSLRLAAAGEMAAALAHELNQPLTALAAYGAACDMLLQNRTSDREQMIRTVRGMVNEARRASGIVSRLRDFFRSGAIQLETIQVADLIREVVATFNDRARQAGTRLTMKFSEEDMRLMGDRLQLEVVLRNLLANAFDAVAEQADGQRSIEVNLQREAGSRLSVVVEDSGPGPEPDMVGQIFEPFVTNKSSGLGLGLAISRAITEAHGGQLVFEPGNHGRFKWTLPVDAMKDEAHG